MKQPPLRIEWAHSPAQWMRPAALSFESSLYQSHGKAPSISENDTLVIHITTFYESCRPENCTGDPSEESDPMKVELVTDPMSYIVSKKRRHINVCWTLLSEEKVDGEYAGAYVALIRGRIRLF